MASSSVQPCESRRAASAAAASAGARSIIAKSSDDSRLPSANPTTISISGFTVNPATSTSSGCSASTETQTVGKMATKQAPDRKLKKADKPPPCMGACRSDRRWTTMPKASTSAARPRVKSVFTSI